MARSELGKVTKYTSNFTLLKDDNDYEREFRRVLRQFSSANLSSEAAVRWIAQSMYEVVDKDASNA